MTQAEFQAAYAFLKEQYLDRDLPIPAGDYGTVEAMLAEPALRRKLGYEAYEKAVQGDYSQFERVDPLLRSYLASLYMEGLPREAQDALNAPEDQLLPEREAILRREAHNPAFRLGCSLYSRLPQVGGRWQAYDDRMTDLIMEDTLAPLTEAQFDTLQAEAGSKAAEQLRENVEKQVQMAKSLLLAHLGRTTLKLDDGREAPMERSVASMMSHCSRTAFVFAPGPEAETKPMMEALTGKALGQSSGVYNRHASTHDVLNGADIGAFRETKGANLRRARHYGMDVAIGGLGNPGIPGPGGRQTLKNDGSCGHMFLHITAPTATTTGSLLLGFESDSPNAEGNQQGHKHTLTAKPEHMSSFLGQRRDEMGAKYGGRIVDCTAIPPRELMQMLQDFSNHYRGLLHAALRHPEQRQRVEEANRMLSGKLMDPANLSLCLNLAGLEPDRAREIAQTSAEHKGIAFTPNPQAPVLDALQAVEEVEKPRRWVRLKAFFGIRAAKEHVSAYESYLQQSRTGAEALRTRAEAARRAPAVQAQNQIRPTAPQRQAVQETQRVRTTVTELGAEEAAQRQQQQRQQQRQAPQAQQQQRQMQQQEPQMQQQERQRTPGDRTL